MQKTNIGWCTHSSNPIKYRDKETGETKFACVHASPGCINCYAEQIGLRFKRGREFTAQNMKRVEAFVDEAELLAIMRLKGPARVFIGDMTDIFGEWVSDELLDRVFDTLVNANNKTFQILTKRAERMHRYFTEHRLAWVRNWDSYNRHIHLGVSAEDQQRADERLPWLMKTPAAVRFCSYEPAIGPVDFGAFVDCDCGGGGFAAPEMHSSGCPFRDRLHWLIIGGESGPKRRPFNTDWACKAAAQCEEAGVKVFFKQAGGLRPGAKSGSVWLDGLKELP